MLLIREFEETIAAANGEPHLQSYARELEEAVDKLKRVTAHLVGLAMQGKIDLFLADATLYLEFFGIITIGWQWLLQAMAAHNTMITMTLLRLGWMKISPAMPMAMNRLFSSQPQFRCDSHHMIVLKLGSRFFSDKRCSPFIEPGGCRDKLGQSDTHQRSL